jgi:hypothetical protein
LSPQLQPFGKSDDDFGELTFGVGRFLLCPHLADGPRGPGGRSVPLGFVPCSSCSCSPFVSIRRDFGFRLDGVSDGPQQRADGPRVPGGQSACSPRTVRGVGASLFVLFVFNGRSTAQDGRSARLIADGPHCLAGRSARGCALCFLVRFLSFFFRASACASRNRS